MYFTNKRTIIPIAMTERDRSHRGSDQKRDHGVPSGRTYSHREHQKNAHRSVVEQHILFGLDLSNGEGNPEDTDFPPGTSMQVAKEISDEFGATVVVSPLDRIGHIIQSAVVIFQRGK
jgi:hypothetical protein